MRSPTQILHRTVSVNVFKGEEVEQALEEVVMQRQFTVQVGGRVRARPPPPSILSPLSPPCYLSLRLSRG